MGVRGDVRQCFALQEHQRRPVPCAPNEPDVDRDERLPSRAHPDVTLPQLFRRHRSSSAGSLVESNSPIPSPTGDHCVGVSTRLIGAVPPGTNPGRTCRMTLRALRCSALRTSVAPVRGTNMCVLGKAKLYPSAPSLSLVSKSVCFPRFPLETIITTPSSRRTAASSGRERNIVHINDTSLDLRVVAYRFRTCFPSLSDLRDRDSRTPKPQRCTSGKPRKLLPRL